MKKLAHCLILLSFASTLLAQPSFASEESHVITYPFPEDLPTSERFHVSVDGQPTEVLQLFDFEDPSRLTHLGGSLVVPPPEMEAVAVPVEEASMAQGHLEGSNVNPIDTLVAMIAAQRAFEVQSKVLASEDEMLEKSVNNLPRIGS